MAVFYDHYLEDQMDFHAYNLRKCTLRSYIEYVPASLSLPTLPPLPQPLRGPFHGLCSLPLLAV